MLNFHSLYCFLFLCFLSFSYSSPILRRTRYTLSEFIADESLLKGERPFIITDAMKGWPAMNQWTIEYFSQKFGNEITDYYPENMNISGRHPYLLTVSDAIEKYSTPTPDPNNPSGPPLKFPSYIQFRFGAEVWKRLLPDISPLHPWFSNNFNWFESCLPPKKKIKNTKKRDPITGKKIKDWPLDNIVRSQNLLMVLIGREGSGMFFHWDNLHSGGWQAHVRGRKRYVLCAPTKEISVKMDAFSTEFQSSDLWNRYECIDEILSPGEIVFWPSDWWHQTRCLDENFIGVTMRVWGPIQLKRSLVKNALESECQREKEDITDKYPGAAPPLSQRVCDNLKKCFKKNIDYAPYLLENEKKEQEKGEGEEGEVTVNVNETKEKKMKKNKEKIVEKDDDDHEKEEDDDHDSLWDEGNDDDHDEEMKKKKNTKIKKNKKNKKSKKQKKEKKVKKLKKKQHEEEEDDDN